MDTQRLSSPGVLIALATTLTGALLLESAQAGWKEMGARLPSQTNAIVAINMDAVMRAPLAVQEKWADQWQGNYQSGPVAVIPGTQRVLAAALLKPGLEDADWRITMMEMREPAVLEQVARSQGGYMEKVQARMAVCAPAAYFLTLDDNTLASFAPADRQRVYNWLCDKMGKGADSPHLRGLVTSLGASTHVLMALDVQEQYSAEGIRNTMAMNPLAKIDPKEIDLDKLAEVLAGVQYVVLKVNVTDKLQATTTIQLAGGADWAARIAKPLTTEILDRVGIGLPELETWTVKVDGNRLTMAGEMSRTSLFDMLSIMGMKTTTSPVEVSDDPAVIARTSRSFYQAICASLDSYPKAASYEQVNRWVQRETQKLENLSLINVDPELVGWSTELTKRMRQVSLTLAADKQSTSAATLSVQNPTVVGGYDSYEGYYRGYGGGYVDGRRVSGGAALAAQNRLAKENAARQRMQMVKQHQADSLKSIGDIMGDLGQSRNAIRAKMTEKYKTPF